MTNIWELEETEDVHKGGKIMDKLEQHVQQSESRYNTLSQVGTAYQAQGNKDRTRQTSNKKVWMIIAGCGCMNDTVVRGGDSYGHS